MKPSTKENYIRRISRVVDFLNAQTESAPSLEQLASVAAISTFHFHRVYTAVTGETPSATMRRLRIAKACLLLRETARPITEIAFDVGYDSSQAFAKTLREMTGSTASELRADLSKLARVLDDLSRPSGGDYQPDKMLDVKLVSIEPFKVIAHRHVGPHSNLFIAYGELFSWAEKSGNTEGFKGIYGIPIDDPRETPEQQARFDCCFDLGPDTAPAGDFTQQMLGGGLYAVTRHVGPYEGLDEKYDYLYGPWLSASGHVLRAQPLFNHYLADPDSSPPEQWETDVYLPVDEYERGE